MHKLLIVEDDLENCDILLRNFSKADEYACAVAHSAEEALEAAGRESFDLLLLDIMLPGMDGVDLCRRLRESMYCPIIFMSCLDDDETIVRAMRMGGDDYLTKPFRFPILLAHIEAVLRRAQMGQPSAEEYRFGDMLLSCREHLLRKGEATIHLSPTEFQLLLYFYMHADTLLSFEAIYEYIWKRPSLGDLRTVFSHVRNLRKKIEADPSNPRHLLTVPREGYIFRR